jgi:hypothetical protein
MGNKLAIYETDDAFDENELLFAASMPSMFMSGVKHFTVHNLQI